MIISCVGRKSTLYIYYFSISIQQFVFILKHNHHNLLSFTLFISIQLSQ